MSLLLAPAPAAARSAVLPAPRHGGRFVRVTRGPMAGLIGRLLDSPESGRCLVEVTLLGEGIYMRIDPAWLESDCE